MAGKGPTWWNQIYDKLLLILALAIVLGSVLVLLLRIGEEKTALQNAEWDKPAGLAKKAEPIDLTHYHEILKDLKEPFQPEETERSLAVSERRVACVNHDCLKPIPFKAVECPHCKADQPKVGDIDSDGDLMSDSFEKDFGLDHQNPNDAYGDLDNDGYSNLEEYNGETDPTDPTDYPPIVFKLRVLGIRTIPFKFLFFGVNDLPGDVKQFQLNARTLDRTYFVQIGEKVEGFEVMEYIPKTRKGPGGKIIDESELILQKGDRIIRLIKDRLFSKEETYGALVWLVDGQMIRIRLNSEFEIKGQKYKVIDIKRNTVLIRDLQTGSEHQIRPLSPEEKEALDEMRKAGPKPVDNPGLPVSNQASQGDGSPGEPASAVPGSAGETNKSEQSPSEVLATPGAAK